MEDNCFNDLKELKKIKDEERKTWPNKSAKILEDNNIFFAAMNWGNHFIVEDRYDFWPTTGKFIDRKTKKSGRGVFNLVKLINSKKGK